MTRPIAPVLAALYTLHVGEVPNQEPADAVTRDRVRSAFAALFGDLQAHGEVYDFKVVCDATNNPPIEVDAGWTNVTVFWKEVLEPVKTKTWSAGSPKYVSGFQRSYFEVMA